MDPKGAAAPAPEVIFQEWNPDVQKEAAVLLGVMAPRPVKFKVRLELPPSVRFPPENVNWSQLTPGAGLKLLSQVLPSFQE